MPIDIEQLRTNHLEIDGKFYYRWSTVNILARQITRPQPEDQRYWQAVYNILFMVHQAEIPVQWPELFYQENEELGMVEFSMRYDIVDDFIIPKDAGALIGTSTT